MERIMTNLVKVFEYQITDEFVQSCNARDLHNFLEVRRDFTNWVKARIEKYGFIEGEDYSIVQNLTSPDLASSKSRQRVLTDYYITLDMAKELAMVENNEVGRKVRKYFIEVEKQAMKELEMRANRSLSIDEARVKVKDTPSLKTLTVLQKQAVDMARRIDAAKGESERKTAYSILCYINDARGQPTPSLKKLLGKDDD
tara:strand:- start:25179 stop:25775 length:597 start_codon:yes stop_codon:yes gene_type:complete